MLKTGLIVLQLVCATAACLAAVAAADIEVRGLRTIAADAVRSYLKFSTGSTIDERMIDGALKTLMSTGLFADAQISRQGNAVTITVVENPIIAEVAIEGASAIEKKTVEEQLKLKPRERFTEARAKADAIRVRDLYRRQGRMATTVATSVKRRSDDRVDVVVVIKEGAVSKIERLAFAGNQAFSERQLRDVISTSESSWFDILKAAAFYDPERIENDRELIRRHYHDHGFPDARVSEVDADLNSQGTAYLVTFKIDEGSRHRFGPSRIETKVGGVDSKAIEAAVKLKPGEPYSRRQIEQSSEAMTELLVKQGHPFARVDAKPRIDSVNGRVDVVFRIEAGRPLYVERIDITGNQRTKDHVIRRELRFAEGDPLNAHLIDRARVRIKALGFFKSVEVKPESGSAPDRTRLTIAVVEQETGEFGFGGGYSSSEGIIGDISWTERNLLGNGQYLRFKVSGSATRAQADIGFTEPHFLGSNLAAGFDLFYKDVDYLRQASYKSRKAGGDLRLGVPITDQLSSSVNYTFSRNTLYDVGPAASVAIREAVPGFPGNASTSYNTSSVGYGVAYDTRDSRRRPTTGVYVTTAQDFAGVGGDTRYLRTVAEARGYYTVADGVTLFGRTSGGVIGGWGGQDVRLLDLFYKGNETVRGFATAGFGPRDTLSANGDALGGRMYLAATGETQFDLPGVPTDLGLRGAVFADAGSLWGVNRTASALPGVTGATPALRASAGVGLTWDSPLGPLRADYAIPLVKQPFDKLQPFSFGLSPF